MALRCGGTVVRCAPAASVRRRHAPSLPPPLALPAAAADSSPPCSSSPQPPAATRRAAAAALLAAAAALHAPRTAAAVGGGRPGVDPRLAEAFKAAMDAQGDFEAMERAWTRAIELAPDNSAAYSNRGTARLQAGRWADAYTDLARSLELETARFGGGGVADGVSALLLNQLGNAEGALGRWQDAMGHYKEAAEDPEMESIATANYALAAFETGQEQAAVREVRQLLRRDPNFLDMRAALAAFLWATGDAAGAEGQFEALQSAGGGLGAAIYGRDKAIARVRNRWPPRATAALDAFLRLSARGRAEGYDGTVREYEFGAAAASGG